jgi:basic membrane protein A
MRERLTAAVQARRAALAMAVAVTVVGAAWMGASSASATHTRATVAAAKPLKVVILSDTASNDGGWTQVAWQSAQAAAAKLGASKVSISIVDNLPYSAVFTSTAQREISQGANVLIDFAAAGQLFYTACKAAPTVTCLENAGAPPFPAKNIGGFYVQHPYIAYLLGEAAGKLSKSSTVGFIAPFKIPSVNGELNAFALGCQKVRPSCVVRTVTLNSWYDPPSEVQAARALVAAGAGALWGPLSDTSVQQYAEKTGVWVGGNDLDQSAFAPKWYFSGITFNWAPYLEQALGQIYAKTWTGAGKIDLIAPGQGANLGGWGSSVPASVRSFIEAQYKAIVAGKNVFVGPIKDQSGVTRVPAGKTLSAQFLFGGWSWLVKGVAS